MFRDQIYYRLEFLCNKIYVRVCYNSQDSFVV